MATTAKQSGFFIQSTHGQRGNFEVVVSDWTDIRPNSGLLQVTGNGLYHLWRDNDQEGEPWIVSNNFARGQDVRSASLIQGNFGNPGSLELVTRSPRNLLTHYWWAGSTWTKSVDFADKNNVRGNPALIQSSHGRRGNFEVVAASAGRGLVLFTRDNDVRPPQTWSDGQNFGDPSTGFVAVSLIQSVFDGRPGDFGVVALTGGGKLVHYTRDHNFVWRERARFGDGLTGEPTLIQSTYGARGNYELVVPHKDGGLVHFWRNNDDPNGGGWSSQQQPFETGSKFWEVSMIQSNYGSLELVARHQSGVTLTHFYRHGGRWNRTRDF